jgi:hypothetical protein
MTQLERAQNILRLADKCTGGPCTKCEIEGICDTALDLLVSVEKTYKSTTDEDFAAIVNRTDAKWRP